MKTQKIQRALMVAIITIASTSVFGQKTTEYLSKKEIGTMECQHTLITDLDKGTKNYYVFILFLDEKYKSLERYKSIHFNAVHETFVLMGFINDLEKAVNQMMLGKNISWNRDRYKITLYDFSDNLYLENENGEFTILTRTEVKKMIEWLNTLDLHKGLDE